jgi:hypothetical protein
MVCEITSYKKQTTNTTRPTVLDTSGLIPSRFGINKTPPMMPVTSHHHFRRIPTMNVLKGCTLSLLPDIPVSGSVALGGSGKNYD